jgi:two-component system, OmpR family, phosphate regulon response regulator PhoB
METKVVIIDDDENLTNLLSDILESEDFEVHVTNDSSQGLDLIYEIQPDLVLLDWMMPGKDGIETLTELKKNEKTKSIPVFMLTAKGMLSEVNQLFSTGADDYISKPFNPDLIAKQIRKKLEKRRIRQS